MDGWVKLGGTRYEVIHLYQQLREPRPGGGGVDTTGCENTDALFASIRTDFMALVRSTGAA
jgi:hypothetical protein